MKYCYKKIFLITATILLIHTYVICDSKPNNYNQKLNTTFESLKSGDNLKTSQAKKNWISDFKHLANNATDIAEVELKKLREIADKVEKWLTFNSWSSKFTSNEINDLKQTVNNVKIASGENVPDDFLNKLDSAKSIEPFSKKVESLKNIFPEAVSSTENVALFMDVTTDLINNRTPNQTKDLELLLTNLTGVAQYNPQAKGKVSLAQLDSLKNILSRNISNSSLIGRANALLPTSVENDYAKNSWLNILNYLSRNTHEINNADTNALKNLFTVSIKNNLEYNTVWADKFSSSQKTYLKNLIKKIDSATKTQTKKLATAKRPNRKYASIGRIRR